MKVNFLLNHTDRETKELLAKIISLLEEFGIFVFDVIEITCMEKNVTYFTFSANKVKVDEYSPNGNYMNVLNDVIVSIFNYCDGVCYHCQQKCNQIVIRTPLIPKDKVQKKLDILSLGLIGNYELYKNGCPFKLDKEELRKIFKEGV